MCEFWKGVIAAICTNGLLLALVGFWLQRELQRHEKQLDLINCTFQTRFSKYHVDEVDAIAKAYGLLVDLHNSVFRYCLPDWDPDKTPEDERKREASDRMVKFYEHFRKTQIFMEDATIAEFEKSFHFLQQVFLKEDSANRDCGEGVQVGMSVYADMTKTLPGILRVLRNEIKTRIEPEPPMRATACPPRMMDDVRRKRIEE